MSFKDILLSIFTRQEVQNALSTASVGTAISDPGLSMILSAVKDGANLADQLRLKRIIQGLASGLNQETMLNELTNYINASEDNAYHVASTLRKAMYIESRKGCVLLGRILADHINSGERYDRDDLIIVHAVESATDVDLVNFCKIMEQYKGEFIEVTDQTTVDWCYSNRIFRQQIGTFADDGMDMTPKYKPDKAAFKLKSYLDEIHQVFREGY